MSAADPLQALTATGLVLLVLLIGLAGLWLVGVVIAFPTLVMVWTIRFVAASPEPRRLTRRTLWALFKYSLAWPWTLCVLVQGPTPGDAPINTAHDTKE